MQKKNADCFSNNRSVRMDGKRKQNKIRKAGAAAAMLGLAVLFFTFLAGFGRTAPDNPMEDGNADASRMYLTLSLIHI